VLQPRRQPSSDWKEFCNIIIHNYNQDFVPKPTRQPSSDWKEFCRIMIHNYDYDFVNVQTSQSNVTNKISLPAACMSVSLQVMPPHETFSTSIFISSELFVKI
jgi:hypothetical protein